MANDQMASVRFFAPVREPGIVLHWLMRLRWMAVVGQVAATVVATAVVGTRLPLVPIAVVIGLTVLTNVGLWWWMRVGGISGWVVPAVVILDECLLTALLFFAGGPENPFCVLYVVHVAMAVVALGPGWTWVIAGLAVVLYAGLFRWHVPLTEGEALPGWAVVVGQWTALVLVAGLIAYFIGRVAVSLRRREEELRAVRERANRNEQLAALTTLAAGAAHELGTPLATIALVAKELELAAQKVQGSEAVAEDAKLIRCEVERCRRILDRMRVDIVEDLMQRVGRIRVDDLLEAIQEDLSAVEQGHLVIRREVGLEELTIPVRAVQQAVGVLVRNAFDANRAGEPVSLSIGRRDGQIVVEVEDHGCGMPEEVLRRAGEPFFTTKEPGRGMGLGLFLVRLVAEKYGGSFKLHSRPGEGTKCVLELPEGAERGDEGMRR